MENKWSVSGAGRKLGEREWSDERRSPKTMKRERSGGCGSVGTEWRSGGPRMIALMCAGRLFLPLTLYSHAVHYRPEIGLL